MKAAEMKKCELSSFSTETAKAFESAAEGLFYSENLWISGVVLLQSRMCSRLHLLDSMILRDTESRPIRWIWNGGTGSREHLR